MKKIVYHSTRGGEQNVSASYAIVKGLAEDGGLFVPCCIPKLQTSFGKLKEYTYQEVAYEVLGAFLTDFTEEEIKYCVDQAYDHKFDVKEITPIVKKQKDYYLELFHGSTIAFKDMALSILPYLMTTAAKKQGITKDIVVLTATSGDTGKAALAGFGDVEGTKIIVFYPKNGVSKIQERQMVTSEGKNTLVVGIDGNFDDAQKGVKDIFNDRKLHQSFEENNVQLSSANSINIGRLLPQVIYYVYTYSQLLKQKDIVQGQPINIVVPTGNFGNIMAAYYAKEMGVPIHKMICASNDNKVLYDFFQTGTYDCRREFMLTISPSMDILVSSNLERLLYMVGDEDTSIVRRLMTQLNEEGYYEIPNTMKEKLNEFYPVFATQEETKMAIRNVFEEATYMLDPHTAVAKVAADEYRAQTEDTYQMVVVSTASPYKFTHSTLSAIDAKYQEVDDFELLHQLNKITCVDIPEAVKDIEKREILHTTVCKKEDMATTVLEFIKKC